MTKRLLLTLLIVFCVASPAISGQTMLLQGIGGDSSNGSVGTSSTGSTVMTQNEGVVHYTCFTATPGTVSYAHFRSVDGDGQTLCVSLHLTDGTTLAYGTTTVTNAVEAVFNITLNTPVTLSAQSYCIAIQNDGAAASITYKRGTLTGANIKSVTQAYDCAASVSGGTTINSDRFIPVLIDNNPTM